MIVVADTGPLNYLVLLGHVDILPRLYGQVIMPPAVALELQNTGAPTAVRRWAADPPEWLRLVHVQRVDTSLPPQLGAGEREAISLFMESKANVLLIDELAGRQQAEARWITITGTLGVLLQASLRNYLDFPLEIQRLHSLGFRSSATLETVMLAQYASAKQGRS